MKIAELEISYYPPLSLMDPATRARSVMRETGARILPVAEPTGRLIGIVTRETLLTITSTRSPLLVRDIVVAPPIELTLSHDIYEAVEKMLAIDEWYSVVIDENKVYKGVFGIEHFLRTIYDKNHPVLDSPVEEFMTTRVKVVRPDDTIGKLWRKMVKYRYAGFPVVDENNRLIGIITQHDLIKRGVTRIELESESRPRKGPRVREVMMTSPTVVFPRNTLRRVTELIVERNISRIPVVEKETNKLLGIIDKDDIARALLS